MRAAWAHVNPVQEMRGGEGGQGGEERREGRGGKERGQEEKIGNTFSLERCCGWFRLIKGIPVFMPCE